MNFSDLIKRGNFRIEVIKSEKHNLKEILLKLHLYPEEDKLMTLSMKEAELSLENLINRDIEFSEEVIMQNKAAEISKYFINEFSEKSSIYYSN